MDFDLERLKDIFEFLYYACALVGIPAGLFQYIKASRKEQQDREYGTYDALDQKYVDFLSLCYEHPELDVFDVPDPKPCALTEEQKKTELIVLTILFSIFERAFLMYRDQSWEVKRRQWFEGWHEYIFSYCRRKNFQDAWKVSGDTFDLSFQEYMMGLFTEAGVSLEEKTVSGQGEPG